MPTCFQSYQKWVQDHFTLINSTEDVLSHLSWILPERFDGSETLLECFHSALGIIALWHRGVANGALDNGIPWVLLLGAIRQVEVLFEMRANHLQHLRKWNKYGPLTALEMTKLILRAILLNSNQARFVLGKWDSQASLNQEIESRAPAVLQALQQLKESKVSLALQPTTTAWPERRIFQRNPRAPLQRVSEETEAQVCRETHHIQGEEQGQSRENASSSTHSNAVGQYWWSLNPDGCNTFPLWPPDESMSTIEHEAEHQHLVGQRMLFAGEVLHMIRPVVYVLALKRWGTHSWRGWSLSLLIDLFSHYIIAKGSNVMRSSGIHTPTAPSMQDGLLAFLMQIRNFNLSPCEEEELARRKRLLLLYMLRSPLFNSLTGRGVAFAVDVLKPIPLLGSLGSRAMQILLGVQQYYCYTSGS